MTAHGALEADFPPGTMVQYRPRPRDGRADEPGLVVRANDHYVFVRFARRQPSKACAPETLLVLADPIPDPRVQMLEDVLAEYRRDDAESVTVYELLGALTDILVGAVDQSTEEET